MRQGRWRVYRSFQCISQPTQVGIVSLRIVRRFGGDDLLFLTGEFRSQLVGDGFGHLTLDRKDVGQFAIKGIGPKMGIIGCFDQLHVHAHGVAALLHASFQDVGDAKLPGDLGQVFRRAFVMLRGSARDHLQIRDLG